MKLNKKQRYAIGIIFIVVYSFILFYFSPLQHIAQAYGKIDSDTKHLLTTFLIAGLGLTLFAARHQKVKKELLEQIEAWDLAVLIVLPSVEIFTYIVKDPSNWPWAILAYIVGVMTWFVLVIYRHKVFKDPKEEKKFTFTVWYAMFVFVVYGTYAVWAFISLTPFR